MTALRLAVLLITAAAAAAAAVYASRWKPHRPVSWYLITLVLLDVFRLVIDQQLPAPAEVCTGWDLWLRQMSNAAYIAMIVALPAMSVAMFLRRRPWLVVAMAAGSWLALAGSYPHVRGQLLLEIYSKCELTAGVFSLGCLLTWALAGQGKATVSTATAAILIAAALAVAIVPELTGAGTLEHWAVVVATQGFSFALILVLHVWALTLRRPRQGSVS